MDNTKDQGEQSHEQQDTGRPLKFQTVEELDIAIQRYFDLCDPHVERRLVDGGLNQKGETIWSQRDILTEQKAYTMSGLARALGVDRRTLLNYKNRDAFFPSVMAAKHRCEEYWEGVLASPYSSGAKFNLVNNFQDEYRPWADKQVMAGDPDAPIASPYAGLTTEQLRKLAEGQTDGADSSDTA